MKKIVFNAISRGQADHGWLKAKHSFSFANYYDPNKVHFGVLRVLNDDVIAPGTGFSTHPHDNMEIITLPLSGDLEHKDSMGNTSVIHEGEIQVMSAGSGIFHSEFNTNKSKELNLFQIWIFPNKKNVEPRYDQMYLKEVEKTNELYQVLSPNKNDDGLWIHQNAWFYMGTLNKGWNDDYLVKASGNGIYVMVIEGEISIAGETLLKRDAIGLSETQSINIKSNSDSRILIMDIPMR
jgi:redox-sensitive bicupin YhaK (pirin superfamily)